MKMKGQEISNTKSAWDLKMENSRIIKMQKRGLTKEFDVSNWKYIRLTLHSSLVKLDNFASKYRVKLLILAENQFCI